MYHSYHETLVNPFGLTDVQVKTIQMVTNGYSVKAMAKMLHVSEGAIKDRLTSIRAKMDVDTTMQAVVLWVREVEFADQQVAA